MAKTEVPESNLIRHANRELDILGYPAENIAIVDDLESEWDQMMRASLLEIVTKFAGQGHSGGSAFQMLAMLKRLLAYQPLSPLTDDPAEWNEVELGPTPSWQSQRHSAAFSKDGGKTYYILDEERKHFRKLPWWLRKKLHGTRLQYPMHTSKQKAS